MNQDELMFSGFDVHMGFLVVVGAVSWLFAPILLVLYRARIIPKRGKEIESVFESKAGAIIAYERLFPQHKEHGIEAGKIVFERFLGFHSWWAYLVPTVLFQVTTFPVIGITILWIESKLHHSGLSAENVPTQVLLAFAGTYLWSIYELLNRITSKDLLPENLYELSLRFLGAAAIGHVASLLAIDKVGGAMAFAACAFPLRDFRLFLRQYLIRKAGHTDSAGRNRVLEGHLADTIEGLSDQKLARLEELNIVTYMDMAYADPVKLMARTGFSLRDILVSIDQALLVVYGHDREPFDKVGIPCALDAYQVFERHCKPKNGDQELLPPDEFIQELAKVLDIAPVFVPEMLQEIYEDPHVKFIHILWN